MTNPAGCGDGVPWRDRAPGRPRCSGSRLKTWACTIPSGGWLREDGRRLRRVSAMAASEESATACDKDVTEGLRLLALGGPGAGPGLVSCSGSDMMSNAVTNSGRRRGQTQRISNRAALPCKLLCLR